MYKLLMFSCFPLFIGCNTNSTNNKISKTNNEPKIIKEFDNYLFGLAKINSFEIRDTLQKTSDTILMNTSIKPGSREGTIYVNHTTNSKYIVYEYSNGSISAIVYYYGDRNINAAEYHPNGQVICKFPISEDGIRNGKYHCFQENGNLKSTGFYFKGEEISDSMKVFKK